MKRNKPTIGFIGQGFIGKNYADDFENRSFKVIRYALEEPYCNNKKQLERCNIVFIAVPTPTVPAGKPKGKRQRATRFDDSILREAIADTHEGQIVVIKSTLLPGTTESIQEQYPDRIIMHSPEFLSVVTASKDAANPFRNIVGCVKDDEQHKKAAKLVLSILPKAPYEQICSAREAEYIKYGGNNWFYFKVIFINLLYDLAQKDGCNWAAIRNGLAADPRIGSTHLNPMFQKKNKNSNARALPFNELHLEPVNKGGRGAGGYCFIKDFAAFTDLYCRMFPDDEEGIQALSSLEEKNISLLKKSGKDSDLLRGVYGDEL